MLGSFKVDESLSTRLKDSASKVSSPEELNLQKISFVYGNLPTDVQVTREHVQRRILGRGEVELGGSKES